MFLTLACIFMSALCLPFTGTAPRLLPSTVDLQNHGVSIDFNPSMFMDAGFSRAMSAGRPDSPSRSRNTKKRDLNITSGSVTSRSRSNPLDPRSSRSPPRRHGWPEEKHCVVHTHAATSTKLLQKISSGSYTTGKKKVNDDANWVSPSPQRRSRPGSDTGPGENHGLMFTRAISARPPLCEPENHEDYVVFTRSISTTTGPPSTRRRWSNSDGQPYRAQLLSDQFTRRPSRSTSPRSLASKKHFSSGTAFYSSIVAQQARQFSR